MLLKVKNFLGISDSEIKLSPITLIAGRNNNGKSNLLEALSLVLLGNDKTTKKDANKLLHEDNLSGEISIMDLQKSKEKFMQITLPKMEIIKGCEEFNFDNISAGSKKFSEMNLKDKTSLIEKYFKIDITAADLKEHLPNLPINEIEILHKTILKKGIDSAYLFFKESTTKIKGAWEQITGESFGNEKAKSWIPKGLEKSEKIELLQEKLREKKAFLDVAKQEMAISSNEKERLTKIVSDASSLIGVNAEFYEKKKTIKIKLEELQNFIRENTTSNESYKCPHCNTELIFDNSILKIKTIKIASKEIIKQIEDAKTKIRKLQEEFDLIENKITDNLVKIRSAESANLALEKIEKKESKNTSNISQETVERLEFEYIKAESDLKINEKYSAAKEKFNDYLKYISIVNVLAPTGLKKTKLEQSLLKINNDLKELSPEWEVILDDSFDVFLKETPYYFLSKSEKYRVNAILQIYFSTLSNSDFIVLDEMDILDSENRKKMFKLLLKIKKCSILIGMTYANFEQAPTFKNPSMTTYWIENGITKKKEDLNE